MVTGHGDEPLVAKTQRGYYVADGNHRVYAAKDLGRLSVSCRIRQVKRQRHVAAADDTDCADARGAGLLGFGGLRIVPTDSDRCQACEAEASEDDPIFKDVLDDLEI